MIEFIEFEIVYAPIKHITSNNYIDTHSNNRFEESQGVTH